MEVHTIAYSKSHRDNGVIQARGKIDDEANCLSTGDGCGNQSTQNFVFTKGEDMRCLNPDARESSRVYDISKEGPTLRATKGGVSGPSTLILEGEDMSDIKFVGGVNPKKTWNKDDNRNLSRNYSQGERIHHPDGISPCISSNMGGTANGSTLITEEDVKPLDCVVTHYGFKNKPHEIRELSPTLKAQSHGHEPMAVGYDQTSNIRIRKLTPVECERLQGYPDGHTAFGRRPDGSIYEVSNSQRYKMCGNGISSPVPAFLFPAIFGTDEYKILDLFSGCHGTGLLLPPNFKTVAFAEIDKYASDVLRYHNPNIPNLGSVTEIVSRTDVPNFNMLVGGFPCQSWSIAGLRKGFSDERGQLIYNVFDILRKFRPKALVLENVKGLLSKDNGDAFEAIMEFLSELGYELDFEVVNSKHFGLAQNRERVFILGKLK